MSKDTESCAGKCPGCDCDKGCCSGCGECEDGGEIQAVFT